jgi:carbon storage regulator
MLVLSRKPGEKILIGENIVVTIVRIGPNTVRLGIEAPAGLKIVREELTLHGEVFIRDVATSMEAPSTLSN